MTFRYGRIPAPRLQAVKVVNNSVISKDLTSGESVKQALKNKLVKICDGFSRIDSVSKKECTGRTRLMRKGI